MIEIFAPKAIPNRTAITTSAVAIQQIDYDVLYLLYTVKMDNMVHFVAGCGPLCKLVRCSFSKKMALCGLDSIVIFAKLCGPHKCK